MEWKKEIEKILERVNKKESYESIGRSYNVTGNYIRKILKHYNCELPKRRKINKSETFNKGVKRTKNKNITKPGKLIVKQKYCLCCGTKIYGKRVFCSNKCQNDYKYKEYIERWKNGLENGLSGKFGISRYIRRYLYEKYNNSCQCCKWGKKNSYTDTIPLEIHHIDGNYKNNNETNLQLLCPNCHSLTETYKSHNKSGRDGRSKYWANRTENKTSNLLDDKIQMDIDETIQCN